MKKVGLLGGTFDPIHFGHLHVAISLYEAHGLDAVWWIPAQINPIKHHQAASAEHRLNMLSLALKEIPMFRVLDIELQRQGASFTIDTLELLQQGHQEIEWHLLLGDDLLPEFHLWNNPSKIVEMAPPYVGARRSKQFFIPPSLPTEVTEVLKKGWTPIPLIEISATEIRKRLKENRFCAHLLPAKVLDYIHFHGLYSSHEKIKRI